MGPARRPILTVATAALMLLSHVLCACGGSSPAQVHATPARTCCQDRGAAVGRDAPAPGHDDDDHACRHCQRIAAAAEVKAKDSDALGRAALADVLPCPRQPLLAALRLQPARLDDIPPRQAYATLLSLHCALIS